MSIKTLNKLRLSGLKFHIDSASVGKSSSIKRTKTSIPISSVSSEDKILLSAFRLAYPRLTRVSTRAHLLYMISVNKDISAWYAQFKHDNSLIANVPEWVPKDENSIRLIEKHKEALSQHKHMLRGFVERETSVLEKQRNQLELINKDKANYFKTLPAFVHIMNYTVNHLNDADQLDIALVEEKEERDKVKKAKVFALCEAEFKKYSSDPDSYVVIQK